jgi:hypothetical protein
VAVYDKKQCYGSSNSFFKMKVIGIIFACTMVDLIHDFLTSIQATSDFKISFLAGSFTK